MSISNLKSPTGSVADDCNAIKSISLLNESMPDKTSTPVSQLNSTETPDQSQSVSIRKKVAFDRLPKNRPLPPVSSFTTSLRKSIEKNEIKGNVKLALIRQSSEYYYQICLDPTPVEYRIIAQTLCDEYPDLKNKLPVDGVYWVIDYK